MFRRQHCRRKSTPILTLRDGQGATCFHGPLEALELPEALVIALSIEFFGDPEPCYIHRGAVKVRVLAEIEAALPAGETVAVIRLPESIRLYLGNYPAAQAVLCTHGHG